MWLDSREYNNNDKVMLYTLLQNSVIFTKNFDFMFTLIMEFTLSSQN